MKDGIYQGKNDLTIEEYHANETHISASSLKHFRKSPKHFKERYRKEEERKSYFDFGNAFEVALLDREHIDERIYIVDTQEKINEIQEARIAEGKDPYQKVKATKDYREWYASELNKAGDRYVIDATGPESWEAIEGMLSACYEDAVINSLLSDIEYQCSIFWTHPNGVKLKTRPDVLTRRKNVCIDVKTDLEGSPVSFAKKAAQLDYPIQAVMQIDGLVSSGKMAQVDLYYWLVVTKEPPYCATLYRFKDEDRAWVTELYNYWIDLLAEGLSKDLWPGFQQYGDKYGIVDLDLPLWYRSLTK